MSSFVTCSGRGGLLHQRPRIFGSSAARSHFATEWLQPAATSSFRYPENIPSCPTTSSAGYPFHPRHPRTRRRQPVLQAGLVQQGSLRQEPRRSRLASGPQDSVPDSASKTWDEQQKLLGKDEETPSARVVIYTMIGHFLSTGERLFGSIYVRCLRSGLGRLPGPRRPLQCPRPVRHRLRRWRPRWPPRGVLCPEVRVEP